VAYLFSEDLLFGLPTCLIVFVKEMEEVFYAFY
jgi:hypothetical protein